jgi:cytidylate kinase
VPRSINALVEEQVRRWQLLSPRKETEGRPPVITVTGQHGAHGDELARQLASKLEFDHFDREIIHLIAESAHLSERVVAALDQKRRDVLTGWLVGFRREHTFSPAEYRYHLARVVGAIAQQGRAVILGRGANILLGDAALRVLAMAPFETRVQAVMEDEGLSEREARRRIEAVEADRHAFILTHYRSQFGDPTAFDLAVNTAALGVDGASSVVQAALAEKQERTEPAGPWSTLMGIGKGPA